MDQTNKTANKEDIKQNPKYTIAQEKYRNLVLSLAKGTNYSSVAEGWNFNTDLSIILETERANGHQDTTYEKLINDMSKMSDKKLAKKYQAYAIETIARHARNIEAKKHEERISKKDQEISSLEQRINKLTAKNGKLKDKNCQLLNLITEHKEAISESYLRNSLEGIKQGDALSKYLEVDTIEKARELINSVIADNENQPIKTRLVTKTTHLDDVVIKFLSE